FGGRSVLTFAVRNAETSSNVGTIEASLVARYELSPGQLTCTFEYDLQPARGPVSEWVFAVDPGLKVTDVVVNNRAGWREEPAAKPDVPRRLRVALREPGAGGKVVVSAVDPARGVDAP